MVCKSASGPGSTIAGGFVPVPVGALMAAWWACRSAPLGVGDFRAWLACREMVARRGSAPPDREPSYTHGELAALLGVSLRRAGDSVRRLVAAGLLVWSGSAIAFPVPPPVDDPILADTIGGGRGSLAVPRRALRLLAGGARPATIAAALGVLLRCLSRRKGGFDGRGRVKASWIAEAFGVDLRRVKAARAGLVELGWIAPEEGDGQEAMNRWGKAYRIDLAWERPDAARRTLPPPPAADGRTLPPPLIDQDPLRGGIQHQDPARGGPAGVELRGQGEENRPLPEPRLDDVRPEDLRDTGRTLRLYEQAVARGLAGPSEADRLRFVAAAEHARAVATRNPGGLFARLVARGWWHFATQDDEEAASRRLRHHLYGRPSRVERPPARPGAFVPDGAPSASAMLEALLARARGPGGGSRGLE